MSGCSALATKADLQQYLPKTEKASIINNAVGLSGQAVQGVLAIQGGKVAQALNASLAAQKQGETLLAANRANASAIKNAANTAYEANRQALIAKGAAIQNANAIAATQAQAANAAAAAAQAQAASKAQLAAILAQLAGLAITAVSFGLIQGQLRATQARIDAQEKAFNSYNADYTRLINLISQNRIAIEANNAVVAANNAIVRNNQSAIAATNSLALDAQSTNRSLANDLNQANERIRELTSQLNAVNSKAQAAISIAQTTSSKLPPVPVIKDLSQVQNLSAENNRLRQQLESQQSDLNGYRVALNNFQARLPTQEDKFITRKVREQTITNASGIKDLNDQYIGIPSKIGQTVKSEFSTSIQTFKQDAQKQVSQAIASINFPEFDISKVSKAFDAKIAKITTDFNERLHSEISAIPKVQPAEVKQIVKTEVNNQIKQVNQVNNQQATEINSKLDNLNSKLPDPLTLTGIATVVGGLDILRQIKNKPIPTPTCLAPALVPPVGVQAKANGIAIGGLQVLNIKQTAAVQTSVNTVGKGVAGIKGLLENSKYGLQAIQKFAETAWKTTQADKVLNVVNTTLLIHNAMMLSNNLFQTMGEATSMALQALGIEDATTNEAIDVNNVVKTKINAMLNSVLGEANYKALTARIAKANRIYQSGINILDATRNMFDATHSIAEVTVRHTGEIGNALRDAGVVYENAYEEMVEKVNPQSKRLMGLQKFQDGIQVVEEAFDSVSQVSGNVLEIQQNVTELKTEKTTLINEINLDKKAKEDERTDVKTGSQVTADPDKKDFEAAPSDE